MKKYKLTCEVCGKGLVYDEETKYEYEHGTCSAYQYEARLDYFDTGDLDWYSVEETDDGFWYKYYGNYTTTVEASSKSEAIEKAAENFQNANFGKLINIIRSTFDFVETEKDKQMKDVTEYIVENNKLILWCHGDSKLIHTPAIMYDKEDNLLLKHGEKADVEAYQKIYTTSVGAVSPEIADQAVLLSFENVQLEKVADFLNDAISTTGCIDEQLQKHFDKSHTKTSKCKPHDEREL